MLLNVALCLSTTLFFAGDSTLHSRVSAYHDEPIEGRCLASWCDDLVHFKYDWVKLDDRAYSGTSTRSFIEEGRWAELMKHVEPGDYVYIQFGHNDQKDQDKLRYAPSRGAFSDNLRRFAKEVRAARATPVFGTPMVRRFFDSQTGKVADGLQDYPQVVRELGKELGVEVVDMNQFTRELVESVKPEESLKWYRAVVNGTDQTHPTEAGAKVFARAWVKWVKEHQLEIGRLFRSDYATRVIDNVSDSSFLTKSGDFWQLDWSWNEIFVTANTLVMPHLRCYDGEGKLLKDAEVGHYQQRVYDPDNLNFVRWRIFVEVPGENIAKRGNYNYSLQKVVVPAETRRLEMSVASLGDRAWTDQLRLSATQLSVLPTQAHHHYPAYEDKGDVVTDAELDAILAKREKAFPKLVPDGDRTSVEINGRKGPLRIWKTCARECPNRFPSVRVANENGFDACLATLAINASKTEPKAGPIWLPDGSVDKERIRQVLRSYLRRAPNAYLMIGLGVAPRAGWAEAHPSEIYRNEKGQFGIFTHCRIAAFRDTITYDASKSEWPGFSYTSQEFAKDGAKFLEDVFAAIEEMPEGKAVIGVYNTGGTDGQWLDEFDNRVHDIGPQATDYSDCCKRRFAEYRRKKYGRDDVDVTLPKSTDYFNASVQHHTVGGPSKLSDYYEFLSQATTEMRLAFAAGIKRGSKGRVLVGSYSPNTGLAGYPLISQSYSKGLLQSPDYDFFAVVPSYEREHTDFVAAAVFDGTMIHRGKLYVSELDLRTPSVCNWGFWGNDFWRENHNTDTFRRKTLYFVTEALTHGGTYHAYDMDGGWYAAPEAMAAWKQANEIAAAAKPMPIAENAVAFVAGERYWDYQSFAHGRTFAYLLREFPRKALANAGLPWNAYLVDDVLEDESLQLPKTVIFGDLSTVSYEQFEKLRKRFCRDGRTVVWSWRPGFFTQDSAKIEAALGLKALPTEARGRLCTYDGRCPQGGMDPLMDGVRGTMLAHTPYYGTELAPLVTADEKAGWKSIAWFRGCENDAALSVRRHEDFTEVYSAIPGGFNSQFCRNLVRESGAYPILETDDLSGFGAGIFYVVAQTDGRKYFRLPKGVRPDRVMAGPKFVDRSGRYSVDLKRGEIFVVTVK